MKDHTKSASGIHPPNELYGNQLHSSYEKIVIPFEIIKMILGFNGLIWRSNYRIIVKIPSEQWIHYGKGEMDTKTSHQFEQSAWIQLSQFNAEDLLKAINQTIKFEDVAKNVQVWQQYRDNNQQKLNYIKLIYQTGVYSVLEEWVNKETFRIQSIEHHKPNTITKAELHELLFDQVVHEEPQINNTETWEISSSSDC